MTNPTKMITKGLALAALASVFFVTTSDFGDAGAWRWRAWRWWRSACMAVVAMRWRQQGFPESSGRRRQLQPSGRGQHRSLATGPATNLATGRAINRQPGNKAGNGNGNGNNNGGCRKNCNNNYGGGNNYYNGWDNRPGWVATVSDWRPALPSAASPIHCHRDA